MEEWVGFKWHEYITRQAMGEFPEHAVHLKEEARTLGVLFRALGGDPALSLVTAEPRHFRTRRRFMQKLAGTHKKFELAWRDEQSLGKKAVNTGNGDSDDSKDGTGNIRTPKR